MAEKKKQPKDIETITHDATRANIPTAEYESLMHTDERTPLQVAYERRNPDLDPQLIWRGKYDGDDEHLVVPAPPLYIQEKIHPKVLIDDLKRHTDENASADEAPQQFDLFADFNGLPDAAAKTEFYQHESNWTNRMILGDSLQVMASLAEREGLRGKVQCIYFDPPYGIKFNSNFQWSTTTRDVKDGNADHITREPEQVKAFRDTWRDGIHTYLSYLRDRLLVARDLLSDTGSIFIQIGDDNVHLVRSLLDEVFGVENFLSQITVQTTSGFQTNYIGNICDYILWYAKNKPMGRSNPVMYRKPFILGEGNARWVRFEDYTYRGVSALEKRGEQTIPAGVKIYKPSDIMSQGRSKEPQPFKFQGEIYDTWHKNSHWKANYPTGMQRLARSGRIHVAKNSIQYVRYHTDFDASFYGNNWTDTRTGSFTDDKVYIVQTNTKVIERCLQMATKPGDLVLDPTCGSGTTAYVAEQWGRRWITIDTSRVSLALARARIMGARYPFYILNDSREGQLKEADLTRKLPSDEPTAGNIRHGFVYERVPHIMLKDIANNAEIDVIWDKFEAQMAPILQALNDQLGNNWQDWQIPYDAHASWSKQVVKLHAEWWRLRKARQTEIDASIAANAEFEYLYDKPYEDKGTVRVAGPFTVESISPHRVLGVDEDDELIEPDASRVGAGSGKNFVKMILESLKVAGVQQTHKEDRITFTALTPWPGRYICAEGRYDEGDTVRRAGVFIGPEFGTVTRQDLVEATREAAEAGYDVVIACAFNFDAHSTEFDRLGAIPILKARMNADLHMAGDLASTGKGNLFVIFGEPDIELIDAEDNQLQVKINGVDVFDPKSGEIRSDGADGIACWFIDTSYNSESFFVRHAYFLGANDPYKSLKTTLKAEIDQDAWDTLNSDISRPFPKPSTGRIAVKVINHLGDEVMKVYRV